MVELSIADKRQQYLRTVVLYKNSPVYVERITDGGRFCIFDLKSQKSSTVDLDFEFFKPPTRRLGMMNIEGSVVFLSRIPVRKMMIGISKENLNIHTLRVEYPLGTMNTTENAMGLCSEALADTMCNVFPSFEEALKRLSGECNAVAFDRMFAVSVDRNIHYKTQVVGEIPRGKSNIYDIVFKDDCKHLITLLDNNHEKTYGITCP